MSPRSRSLRVCEYCGTSYTKREHYERHIRTHTQEKPFHCSHCPSRFSRRDTLRRHIRGCHSDISSSNGTIDPTPVYVPSTEQNSDQDPALHLTEAEPPIIGNNVSEQHLPAGPMAPSLLTAVPNEFFEWQWDPALNLNPSFSIEDLCTFDPNIANSSIPWLSLPPSPSREFDGQIEPPTLPDPLQQMRPHWCTHVASRRNPAPLVGPLRAQTPTAARGEISRDALASSLKQRVPDTTLPSAEFLNRCIHTFTTRLWPVVPVIHLPSFQPARTNPLLLLSICSFGALADGSKQALYHAERLFEAVHKTILVSSSPESFLDQHPLPILQAAVIGQTFALLSGKAAHLLVAHSFHGTLCIAVRKFYDFALGFGCSSAPPESAEDWCEWVKVQTTIRLLNTLHIHNGEVAAIMQQPAFLRTQPMSIPVAAPDNLFLAKTAEEWVELQRIRPGNPLAAHSIFSSCAKLECFIGEISHVRFAPFGSMKDEQIDECQASLKLWFLESAESFKNDRLQRLSMLELWHSCHISLLGDINLMEKACGRDGFPLSNADNEELHSWIATPRAKRCVTHAILLCKLVDDLRIFDVPAIHVARSLWQAGLVLAVYSCYVSARSPTASNVMEVCPEIDILRESELLSQDGWSTAIDETSPARCKTIAFGVSTALRHLGPWPIAAHYALTLDQVLNFMVERDK